MSSGGQGAILITGSSGFLGSLVTAAALAETDAPLVLPIRAPHTHERVVARIGGRARREDRVAATCAELATCGFEPRQGDDLVTLANCPFHDLAADHTELTGY